MPVKKKVKEPSGVYNPFWTKEAVETFGGSTIRSFRASSTASIMHYKSETHLPFYALPRMPRNIIDAAYYSLRNVGTGLPLFVNAMDARKDPKMKKLFTQLWEKGKYEQFMVAMCARVESSGINYEQLKARLRNAWDISVNTGVDTNLYLPDNPSVTGALNVIKQAKIGSHWGMCNIHSKTIRTGPWSHPRYLYGRYFIAHYVDLQASGIPMFVHGGTQYDTHFVPVPLMSLMFKIEHLGLIKGYMMNNKEVPAELLELWVDESLDELSSPHPIRLQYVRNIKKPLEEAGVTIRVMKLDEAMFERMVPPKFKSLKLQKTWVDETLGSCLENERMANGIITKKEQLDKSLDAIFQQPDIRDAMQAAFDAL